MRLNQLKRSSALIAFIGTSALAQSVITTVAGTDWLFPGDGRPAVNAPLGGSLGMDLAVDRNGVYYIAVLDDSLVLRVGRDGIIDTYAGNGLFVRSGDGGLAINASVPEPTAIALDFMGNLYIATIDGVIRKVTPDGAIATFAGTGVPGYSGDGGPALKAQFGRIFGLVADSSGNLYASDYDHDCVRRISTTGIVTTVAGTGVTGSAGDGGPASAAQLNAPLRIAVDAANNIYIADFGNVRVRMVSNGVITTIAGGGNSHADGVPATAAALIPMAIAFDAAGNLFIADLITNGIRKVDLKGFVTTIVSNGRSGFSGDGGPALQASFSFAFASLAFDPSGNLLFADNNNRRVRRIDAAGTITTIAGNGLYRFSGNGGPATSATLDLPNSVAVDSTGNLYVTEPFSNRIRRIAPDGTISVFAGTGVGSYTGDNGPATSATMLLPEFLVIDGHDNLYFSDAGNNVIRKIDTNGIITIVAGSGNLAPLGDSGPALYAASGRAGFEYRSTG